MPGLALLPLALIGSCAFSLAGGDDEPEPRPAAAEEEEYVSNAEILGFDEDESDVMVGRAAFLLTMRDLPGTSAVSDDQLMEAGEAVCTGLDAGLDVDTITATTINSGAGDVGVMIIGAAANSLCPEYSQVVSDYASSLG